MGIFNVALAESNAVTELENELNQLSGTEAASAGLVLGMTLGAMLAIGLVWFVLQVIADWKIFTKAGVPGWKSIIPIYNYYIEYSICWNGMYGLVFGVGLCLTQWLQPRSNMLIILVGVVGILALVLHFMESMRLARSFGKGGGFGFGLFLLGPIFRLVLGFGSARYIGNRG